MAGDTIRIRMYAVGFGDCFLIGFPAPDRERLVLIDCGVHNASQRGADLRTQVIPDILKEASAATGSPHLDVVVATHHHLDHVAGFKFEGWDEVDVGEVWLPWTENPNDPDAQRIRATQSRQASFLLALDPTKDKEWETIRAISENNVGYTNGPAMTTLHDGFAGQPTRSFLPEAPGQPRERRFRPVGLPGVEVVVLGPSRDEAAIRDMNPPDNESYLRLAGGRKQTGGKRQVAQGGEPLPFAPMSEAAFVATNEEYRKLIPKRADLGRIVNAGHSDALALAVALEQATNGTSLMLLFRVGDTTMLFPGDAQWGTWDRVLHDPEGQDLLRSVNFYKVGHHGSHNATPVSFVETYLNGADASMVSVGPTSIPSWGDIPRPPLLDKLRSKSAILLDSDDLREAALAGQPAPANHTVTEGPGGLWTEIRLPVVRTGP
jgi:beta-lactamase superfamily II metal-dependent hydrolase